MGEFPDNITEFHISSGKSGEFPDECALLRGEEDDYPNMTTTLCSPGVCGTRLPST